MLPSAQRNSILFFGMIAGAWATERRQDTVWQQSR
jgi:hypothetical protein